VKVGVAYGSNVALVKKLLIEAALENKDVTHEPSPIPRFLDFGNSSLDFEILFWSKKMFEIEQIRSDIRTAIDAKFRENNITIPFPQRDLHVKSGLSDVLK
jgi:small-conductance mechanosensitive channel